MRKNIIFFFFLLFCLKLYSEEIVSINLVGYPKLYFFSMNFDNNTEITIDDKIYNLSSFHVFPEREIIVTDQGEDIVFNEIIIKSYGYTNINCKYGGQNFKGDFILKRKKEGLFLINKVKINDYFAAVLGAEMGDSFSIETLKAQAISIRSYYYSRKEKYKDKIYDINNTDGIDMVYRGSDYATKKMYTALKETKNIVLIDNNGDIGMPLFHSTSGGIILKDRALTSKFNEEINDIVLLYDTNAKGIPLSINSPYFKFSAFFREDVLRDILSKELYIKEILDIKLKYFKGTDCVDFIGFIDQNNSIHWLKGYNFISLVQKKGFFNLRSIQFNIKREGNTYYFNGKGFGHLCGMSQYSAEKMAKQGASYLDILKKFYPHLVVKKIKI